MKGLVVKKFVPESETKEQSPQATIFQIDSSPDTVGKKSRKPSDHLEDYVNFCTFKEIYKKLSFEDEYEVGPKIG